VRYSDPRSIQVTEPRIYAAKRILEELMGLVSLQVEGNSVTPDGMRLRDLNCWTRPFHPNPNNVLSVCASKGCNVSCEFCFIKGSPPDLACSRLPAPAEEVEAHVRFFNRNAGSMLFPYLCDYYELLLDPKLWEHLEQVCSQTLLPAEVVTNGTLLTEDVICRLKPYEPNLILSLNSADPAVRRRVMNDPNPSVAIDSVKLLRKHEVPFAVSIVAWPTIPLSDIRSTIEYVDEYDPLFIRVCLPGYTKYMPPKTPFDWEDHWAQVVTLIRELRRHILTPIATIPYLFEDNLCEVRKNKAITLGTTKNSPGYMAGIRPGDEFLEIDGTVIHSRPHARNLLYEAARDRRGIRCAVRRGSQLISVEVDPRATGGYPFIRHKQCPINAASLSFYGIVIPNGFRISYLSDIDQILEHAGAKNALILTSRLVKPLVTQALEETRILTRYDIELTVPRNNYLGGNIIMGDLLVVADYVEHINEWLASHGRPDVVLLPSSAFSSYPGGWERDLRGVPWRRIPLETGANVKLMKCETIYL